MPTSARPPARPAAVGLSVVLALVAGLLLGAAVDLAWARATVLDTDGYLRTIARPLLEDDQVRAAIATDLADQTIEQVDVAGGFAQIVPPEYQGAARAAGSLIEEQWKESLLPAIREQIDAAGFASLWEQANRDLHRQLLTALSDPATGDTATLDLHPVLQRAVRNIGEGVPLLEGIFEGLADALPAEMGRLPVDVSDVNPPARFVVGHVDGLMGAAAIVGIGLLVVALIVSNRRAVTIVALGIGLVVMAAIGAATMTAAASGAGDAFAARARGPVSAELRFVVDRQAALAADSFRPWAIGLGLVGLVAVVGGGIAAVGTRRRDDGAGRGEAAPPPGSLPRPVPADAPSGWQWPVEPPYRRAPA